MKKHIIAAVLLGILSLGASAQIKEEAPPNIGGYNVYFGDLHNHSDVSRCDTINSGTPLETYTYAKFTGNLDFFCLTDHSNHSPFDTAWGRTKQIADSLNEDGVFTAFYGFEWTHWSHGHVNVINSDDYCDSETSITNTFSELVDWVNGNDHENVVAFFNHPGYCTHNGSTTEFDHFDNSIVEPSDKFVGIELWNADNNFNRYYYDNHPDFPANPKGGFYVEEGNRKTYIDEANERGWKLGASGAGDNHWPTAGTRYNGRLAILSNNLTRTDLINAMKARRFYSTLDKNLYLSFKIGGQEMGSSITEGNHTFKIQAEDGDGETFVKYKVLNQDLIQVAGANYLNPQSKLDLTFNLRKSQLIGEYYYVIVIQTDGDEAISSPIWISSCASPNIIENRTITADETIDGCDVRVRNVTVQNNADVIIDARESTTLEYNVELKLGTSLEIK